MTNNIFPEKIIKTRGSDGTSYTSSVYSLEALANLSMIEFLVFVALLIALSCFISAIFMLFYCIRINVKPVPNSHNLFGALAGIYLLVDFYFRWYLSDMVKGLFSHDKLILILSLNVGLIIVHTFLLFTGDLVSQMANNKRFLAIVYVSLLLYYAYQLGHFLIVKNIFNLF